MKKLFIIALIASQLVSQAQDSNYTELFKKADSAFYTQQKKEIKQLESDINKKLDQIQLFLNSKGYDIYLDKFMYRKEDY